MTPPVIPPLRRLVALQELDNEIKELKDCLDLIPGQIDLANRELESKKSRLNTLKEDILGLQKKRNQMEQDVKSHNDQLVKTQQKLPAVKTNQEYSALLKEIDSFKEKISKVEDQELEIMEALEEKEKEIPEAQKEFEGYQKEFGEYKSRKEAEQSRIRQELDEANTRRAELVGSIDPKLVGQYEKVLKRKGDRAVAQVKGETCQGCYQKIQPQMALEVKSNDMVIHTCQYCQRFLYAVAEPAEETESAVSK